MTNFKPELGFLLDFGSKVFAQGTEIDFPVADVPAHNAKMLDLITEGMRQTGRGVLYLSKNADGKWIVTDFTGKFTMQPLSVKKSGHNMADRFDAWFRFEGFVWHGVNIGDNEILRCRRTKTAA